MAETTNKPAIRFPEFTDPWEQRKLGELVSRVSLMSGSDTELPRVEYEDIVSGQGHLNKNIYEKNSTKSGIRFNPGDVLFGKLRPYLQNWLLPDFTGIAVGDWWVLRPNDTSSEFVYTLIQNPKYQAVSNISTGTKMPRSDWSVVSNTAFAVPLDANEQNKIGAFFTHLDRLITLHQRKLEHLRVQKKGLLQKMFPKEGSDTPEIRFPDFTDAWEQRKLGSFTTSYSGGTPAVGKSEYYGGCIPFIRSAEINADSTELFLTESGLNNSSAKMVSVGDILYALYGATSGEVGRSRLCGAINQAIMAIKPTEKDDSEFITQWLRGQKKSITNTYLQGGQGNLSGNIVKELVVTKPVDKAEQTAIGTFFAALDRLIALHQRKLEHLQDQKKALLQQMFI